MGEQKIFSNTRVEKKDNKIEKITPVERLAALLINNNLSKEVLIEEADKIRVKNIKLGFRVLDWAEKTDDFIKYANQRKKTSQSWTEIDVEDAVLSFLEKIQQKPKKEEIKKEEPVEKAIPTIEDLPPQKEILIPTTVAPVKKIETVPASKERRWQEVPRETEVLAVEDLDGDMSLFEKHVKTLGVAKKDAQGNWNWTGGERKLVFLGDILGDRNMDGMQIVSIISDLNKQAEKQKGKVDMLCGNHDMEFIRFLFSNTHDIEISIDKARKLTRQSIGVWELAQFDPDPNSELKKINPLSGEFRENDKNYWTKLYTKMPDILANMRSVPEGMVILEAICRIKVAIVYDDTLFFHTDPTAKMVEDLVKRRDILQRVEEINHIFQENMHEVLFNGKKAMGNLEKINEIYLNVDNRSYFVEESFKKYSTELLRGIVDGLSKGGKIRSKSGKVFFNDGVFPIFWENLRKNLLTDLVSCDFDEFSINKII